VKVPETISQDDRLAQLVLAGLALTTEASLEGVLQRVAEIATKVIGARYAAIGVLGSDSQGFERFVSVGMPDAVRERIGTQPCGGGVLALAIRHGGPLRMADLTRHPESSGIPQHHPPMHSFLGVPVAGRRGTFGYLFLTEKRGTGGFTDDDEHIAGLLAAMTSAAVENARLHEESARLLTEVQQLHRARERFFAMVNHELRNALAAVYGWSELLVRRKDPRAMERAATEVLESAEQAVALINDLLDLSRLDEHRLRPHLRPVKAGSLARHAIARELPAAEAKQLTVVAEIPDGLPIITTDASRVEQILVNLLSNAVKHTPSGRSVLIRVEHDADTVTYHCVDEGPGISEADADRIFDVYVTDADEEKHGVGLGLPLSRRLARLLGGELHAVPRDGAGVFVLRLPRIRESDAGASVTTAVDGGSP
jgi:signal transduction histidine kinase